MNNFGDVSKALDIAYRYGQMDGDHHKTWAIDQMVRALTGPFYEKWVDIFNAGNPPGEHDYNWDVGTPP